MGWFRTGSFWMYSCNCSKGCRLGGHRKANDKNRSLRVKVVVTDKFACMFADNAVADAQAQARALADILGSKERIKNGSWIGDAGAVIAKGNLDECVGARAHDLNASGASGFTDSVVSVIQDIEKHLLQLVRISDDLGQGLVEPFDHLNAVTDEVVGAQVDGALQDGVDLHGLALRRHLAGKAEQVLHDLLGALGFLQNDAQIAARAFGEFGVFHQEVGKSEDGGERIVDFVGDAGDQLSNGRHFLGVHEFGAQHGGVGNVGHHYYDAADPAILAP